MQELVSNLTPLDLIAVLIVFFNAVMGLVRGFVFQLVRLSALIGGLLLARAFADDVEPLWQKAIPSLESPADAILSYFSIFFAVVLVSTLVLYLLRGILAKMKLQSYDRLLGLLLGAIKGSAIVVVAVLILSQFTSWTTMQETLSQSETARLSAAVVENLSPLFPDSLGDSFENWLEELKDTLPAAGK